ncbi:MAG: hypothetical protein ACRCXC_02040 [Legionella sp.]
MKNCLCHLIQPAIQRDANFAFKLNYFSKHTCNELYDFLEFAYPLLLEDSLLMQNHVFFKLNSECATKVHDR